MREQLWSEVPEKVRKRMLEEQVLQGNKKDEIVFKNELATGKDLGGFDWWNTLEGDEAWEQAIFDRNYNLLYKLNKSLKP